MKKRFLIPLLAVAAPLAIGIADAAIHFIGCGIGNQGACTELARRQQYSKELDAKHAKQVAKAENRAATREIIRAAKPVTLVTLISQDKNRTLAACEAVVRANLVDPQSFRHVHTDYVKVSESAIAVKLTYSATNAFGGRIQQQQVCGL